MSHLCFRITAGSASGHLRICSVSKNVDFQSYDEKKRLSRNGENCSVGTVTTFPLDIQPLCECKSRRSPRTIEKSRSGIPLSIILRRELSIGGLSKASFSLPPLSGRQQSRKQWLSNGLPIIVPPPRTNDRSIDRSAGFHRYFDSPAFYTPYYYGSTVAFPAYGRGSEYVRAAVCLARLGTISLPYHLCCLVTHRGHFFIIMSRRRFLRASLPAH